MSYILSLLFATWSATTVAGDLLNLLETNAPNTTCAEKIRNSGLQPLTQILMFDASTKIPEGLLDVRLHHLGDFNECYRIRDNNVYGKYCLGAPDIQIPEAYKKINFGIHPPPNRLKLGATVGGSVPLSTAICVPSFCSADEISGFIKYSEGYCHSKNEVSDLSNGAIGIIVFLCIILLINICSTTIDVYYYVQKKGQPKKLLIAFSLFSNTQQLLKTSANSDMLTCLGGIRTITMMWVIYGHGFSNSLTAPVSSFRDLFDWYMDSFNMYVIGATISVDTFFLIGGLVTVYVFLKSQEKKQKFNILLYYLLRYIRLTPALFVVLLINMYLIEYLPSGPLSSEIKGAFVTPCEKSWWTTLLYISNYVQIEYQCLPQTWYLAVDTQLYVLTPLFLIPLRKYPLQALTALGFTIIAGIISPFVIGYTYELNAFDLESLDYGRQYYLNTYARFGPYVMGMMLGYIIYEAKKRKIAISLAYNILLWLIILAGLLTCVYAPHKLIVDDYNKIVHSLFLAFQRPGWALFVAGVIFLCVTGNGGPVNWFLSLPIFQILGKLSYCMYLTHYTTIGVRYMSSKNIIEISNFTLVFSFWGDFMVSLGLAFILCLGFESPMICLTKYFLVKERFPPRVKKATAANGEP